MNPRDAAPQSGPDSPATTPGRPAPESLIASVRHISGADRAADFLPTGEMRPVKLQASCLKLRHKLMYVDERQSIPGLVDDSSDTRIFFCVRSQESLGPDGEPVSPRDCVPGRSCYCA